eukprot:scaffold17794_cov57-Phaeocystis_antarctica.AAC.5
MRESQQQHPFRAAIRQAPRQSKGAAWPFRAARAGGMGGLRICCEEVEAGALRPAVRTRVGGLQPGAATHAAALRQASRLTRHCCFAVTRWLVRHPLRYHSTSRSEPCRSGRARCSCNG